MYFCYHILLSQVYGTKVVTKTIHDQCLKKKNDVKSRKETLFLSQLISGTILFPHMQV